MGTFNTEISPYTDKLITIGHLYFAGLQRSTLTAVRKDNHNVQVEILQEQIQNYDKFKNYILIFFLPL